jgi:putative hydrolase of the HAD superfamily
MIIKADSKSFFVFDLDDTLYSEIDFLESAYKYITLRINPANCEAIFQEMLKIHNSGGNAFKYLIEKYPEKNLSVENLLLLYRNHPPDISLREGVTNMLNNIRISGGKIGIITDGRSITQRNKIEALGIGQLIDRVIISEEFGYEKPSKIPFESFMVDNPENLFFYFGDNLDKDFLAPKQLGWTCIGIFDERNIHKKNISEFSNEHLPHIFVSKFSEIDIV